MEDVLLGPSEFVALVNQTFEFAYPYVMVKGEIANFRISKNRWVYFDLKDESASVKCFGTVYQLPGPLEDGMLLKVAGNPRLHNKFGFSINLQSMAPSGEGSIKKASQLLFEKLKSEGLFDDERKRPLPYPPATIGLIASGESAGYSDFLKIIQARWPSIGIEHVDVQVQGEKAVGDVVRAIEYCNAQANPAEVLVITRGGGSADDMAAFSDERLARAIVASRIPTLVAIGHERDESLAELVADMRASTPSNAAELLVPDRLTELGRLEQLRQMHEQSLTQMISRQRDELSDVRQQLDERLMMILDNEQQSIRTSGQLLKAYDPQVALTRGYALARDSKGVVLRTIKDVAKGQEVSVRLRDGTFTATIEDIQKGEL